MKINASMILVAFENTNVEDYLDALQQSLEPFKNEIQKFKLGSDAPAEIPRLVARSNYGHSTIVITNQSIQITTFYDDNYGCDTNKVYEYINEKLKYIQNIVNDILHATTTYTGLNVNIEEDCINPIEFINDKFIKISSNENIYDNSLKLVYTINNNYFVNFEINILKVINGDLTKAITKLPESDIVGNKLGIAIDINDKYAYNQNDQFNTDINSAYKIIELSKKIINNSIPKLLEKGEITL